MKKQLAANTFLCVIMGIVVASCTSSNTQALINEYNQTIPTCDSDIDCRLKMETARQWVINNATFGIRNDELDLIDTFTGNQEGSASIRVERTPIDNDSYQELVSYNCIEQQPRRRGNRNNFRSICPPLWEKLVDFNRFMSTPSQ